MFKRKAQDAGFGIQGNGKARDFLKSEMKDELLITRSHNRNGSGGFFKGFVKFLRGKDLLLVEEDAANANKGGKRPVPKSE